MQNSEANGSKFLENLEEMFPQYCMHGDVFSKLKYSRDDNQNIIDMK